MQVPHKSLAFLTSALSLASSKCGGLARKGKADFAFKPSDDLRAYNNTELMKMRKKNKDS